MERNESEAVDLFLRCWKIVALVRRHGIDLDICFIM